MTAQEFKDITGFVPIQDDLDRVNCKDAGKPGHHYCGVCPTCNWPIFMNTPICKHSIILKLRGEPIRCSPTC